MTRCTCREQEVGFILRNLLKVLHQLKLGRVAAFFFPLWSPSELRFAANWPSEEEEEVWMQQMALKEPEVSPQT